MNAMILKLHFPRLTVNMAGGKTTFTLRCDCAETWTTEPGHLDPPKKSREECEDAWIQHATDILEEAS